MLSGKQRQLAIGYQDLYGVYQVNSLQFTPNGQSLVAGYQSCQFQAWDLSNGQSNGKVENVYEAEGSILHEPVESIAPAPNNQNFAVNHNQTVLFFNLASQTFSSVLTINDTQSVQTVTYLPDGKRLVIGTYRSIELWELDSQRMQYQVDGPPKNLSISPNGELIATSDELGTIYLWSVDDGQPLAELHGHCDEITQLTFSRDGKYLASTSKDGTVRLWGVP